MGYYFEIITILGIAFCSVFLVYYSFRNKNGLPTNWPIVGMLPALLINLHKINDYFVEIMEKNQLTFLFEGPWFSNMYLLATIDPDNVHHIMSKNFGNYPKGSKFNEIFDVLGDGIFNTDSSLWQYHRRMAQSFIGHPHFHQFLVEKIWEKVEGGLIPILDHVSKQGLEIDLQDLFERFTFDTICTIIMNYDPRSLSIDFPSVPPSKALDDVEEAVFYRHVVPTCVWKFQRWLGVGLEKKYRKAWRTLDDFIYKCISRKRQQIKQIVKGNKVGVDLMTLYMHEESKRATEKSSKDDNGEKFLRDTILNFFIAGRDTTSTTLSWFFYLLSKNPQVLSKIKQELASTVKGQNDNLSKSFEQLSDKLVYLHGALCEALRLYPPVVFEHKSPIESDILPSGHLVNPKTQIIFNLYAMARMKSIWGDDCYEFKPERWISERGKIRHEPSYKFLAFNAGPRTCVGKNMAFIQMKAIATTIIQNYHIQAVQGHLVVPNISIILHMKHGFKVRVLST